MAMMQTQDQTNDDFNVPAAMTDAGCERELNEDRYAVIESASGLAWLVCDGMGGVAGGELAAQLAIDAIRRELESAPARRPEDALKGSILEANRIIVLRRQNQAFAQMGTTVVGAIFAAPEVVIGNAGDSRAYLIRNGAIQQLTTDHTYVQGLVEKGQIKPEEALSHPNAHILTRCIGSEPGLLVDAHRFWIWPDKSSDRGDCILLCTDGLYSHVSDKEMASIVTKNTPQRACVELVEIAKTRGGYDNITLAIIPLGGSLMEEPPAGFEEKQLAQRAQRQSRYSSSAPKRNLAKDILIVVTLVVLAILLTVVLFAVLVGQ